MSTIKNPERKKLLSLKHDRRNVYGENAKSSRKNIPRSKQRSNQSIRAAVAQILAAQTGSSSELNLDEAESLARDTALRGKRNRFKKWPDAPLFVVLLEKKTDRPYGSISWQSDRSLQTIDRLRRELHN